jgi:hypothetical protein
MDMDPGRDPHRGSCGMCHNPHRQQQPAAARATCTQSACHPDWRSEPFHLGVSHRRAVQQCTTCHLPHQAAVDASDCAGCHRAVTEREPGRRALPQPFDTTRALRRTSWIGPHEEPRGKGDASPPPEEPPLPVPRSPSPVQSDTFSHDRHKQLSCITCHAVPRGGGRLTFEAPRGCQICHHQAPATSTCGTCHAPAELDSARVVSARVTVAGHQAREREVAFSHRRHDALRCTACHATPVTLAPSTEAGTCAACHDAHHAGARNCAACHVTDGPIREAHAPPREAHVACDACHASEIVARLTPDRGFCVTCHAAQGDHYIDRACTACHFQMTPDAFRGHLRRATEDA